jgi:hypothetical protein
MTAAKPTAGDVSTQILSCNNPDDCIDDTKHKGEHRTAVTEEALLDSTKGGLGGEPRA